MPLPLFRLGLVAAAGYYVYNKYRKSRGTGSQTNASDAVDDIDLRPNASADELLDAGVQETFPASDPVSVDAPSETAYEKRKRLERLGSG